MRDDRTMQIDSVSDDAENSELAMRVKSALESPDAQVAAVIWPSSTLQIINLKGQCGNSRQS
jgi:hypothetical protein